MNARDDYQHLAWLETARNDGADIEAALDEIDELRRWKAEALVVLGYWDDVAALVPAWRVRLGDSKSMLTAEYVVWLETQVHAPRVFAPDPSRVAVVRRQLTDRIPHFNTSEDEK